MLLVRSDSEAVHEIIVDVTVRMSWDMSRDFSRKYQFSGRNFFPPYSRNRRDVTPMSRTVTLWPHRRRVGALPARVRVATALRSVRPPSNGREAK